MKTLQNAKHPIPVEGDRLAGFDFAGHNAEVREMWDAFNSGRPTRIPIVLGTNTRYFMFNKQANPEGIDFRRYSEDPDLMFDTTLHFQRWRKFNLLQDEELGPVQNWKIAPDFQNYHEAAWFGCKVHYMDGQVPDTLPEFAEAPERLMDQGLPDPFEGGMGAIALRYYEHFRTRAERETFLGRPIEIDLPMCGTDGPMTVAVNLFGADFVCEAMLAEPDRLHRLLDFITEATIRRVTAWRSLAGLPVPFDGYGFADDSVAMISATAYCDHILPYHRRLCDALGSGTPRSIHLCGDATRHFRTIRDELNVHSFDTGFPVNFGALRQELGEGVRIYGGPHVEFLMRASQSAIRDEVQRILESGILEGGKFVLREGNNLAPYTPVENTEALYHAGREFGVLDNH